VFVSVYVVDVFYTLNEKINSYKAIINALSTVHFFTYSKSSYRCTPMKRFKVVKGDLKIDPLFSDFNTHSWQKLSAKLVLERNPFSQEFNHKLSLLLGSFSQVGSVDHQLSSFPRPRLPGDQEKVGKCGVG
jgi:hypothetical protein